MWKRKGYKKLGKGHLGPNVGVWSVCVGGGEGKENKYSGVLIGASFPFSLKRFIRNVLGTSPPSVSMMFISPFGSLQMPSLPRLAAAADFDPTVHGSQRSSVAEACVDDFGSQLVSGRSLHVCCMNGQAEQCQCEPQEHKSPNWKLVFIHAG